MKIFFYCFVFLFTQVILAKDAPIKESYEYTLNQYEKAKALADKGDANAMLEVFNIFYNTYPVLENKTQEAANYLMKSAVKGNVRAQFNMGFLQQTGDVFEKNIDKALFWLLKAEEGDHHRSARQLGFLYLRKYHENKSKEDFRKESLIWFHKAALRGDPAGMRQYAVGLLSSKKDDDSFYIAEDWLKKAIDKGDVSAMYYLALYYELKFDTEKDKVFYDLAKELYVRSAKLGNKNSLLWVKENINQKK